MVSTDTGNSPVATFGGGDPAASGGAATGYLASAVAAQNWMTKPMVFTAPPHTFQIHGRNFGSGGKGLDEYSLSEHAKLPVPQYATPFQLMQSFDQMDRKKYLQFKNGLVAAGYVSPKADAVTVRTAYATVLKTVQALQDQHINVTPLDYLNSLIKKNGFDPNKIPGRDGWDPTVGKPSTRTETQNSVYDLDPASARQMLTQMLQQNLGRNPTDQEIQDFADAVKTRAADNPQTTQTTYSQDSNGNMTTDTKTINDGFGQSNAQNMALHRAQNAPDYKSYQAVSTYFPALMQALGATV